MSSHLDISFQDSFPELHRPWSGHEETPGWDQLPGVSLQVVCLVDQFGDLESLSGHALVRVQDGALKNDLIFRHVFRLPLS